MDADILQTFRWEVSEARYQIVRAIDLPDSVKALSFILMKAGRWPNPNQWLVAPVDPSAPVRTYCPFSREHSAMFREFAACPDTSAGILELANRYGLLHRVSASSLAVGDGVQLLNEADLKDAFEGLSADQQAPIKDQYEALFDRRGRLLKQPSRTGIDFEPADNWVDLVGSLRKVLGDITDKPLEIRDFRHGGPGDLINLRLEDESVGHRLFWHQDHLVEGPVPLNLAGAIWLQVAFSVVRRAEYRICANEGCRRPFEVAAGLTTGKRANATFCSDRCKSQEYRDRKTLAKTLKAQGVPLRSIARQVIRTKYRRDAPSPTTQVKAWLQKSEPRSKKGGM